VTRLANLRDVAAGTTRLRPGVLFRSDAPHAGDLAPALEGWPPRTVLDLRSAEELANEHPLAQAGAEVIVLPLAVQASLAGMVDATARYDGELGAMYRDIVAGAAPALVRAVALIAESDGPVLVHCTMGKDRTGLLVAAVLAAVGEPRERIVADYALTEANVPGVLERVRLADQDGSLAAALERAIEERPWLLQAPASAIEAALDLWNEHPGGAAGWLQDRGVSPQQLTRLRERLLA
jgi:protein-tyrosine phosphatase